MAKRSNKLLKPNGIKTSDLIDAPLTKVMAMSKADLKRALTQLSMESNKRLAAFKRKGITSPATAYIKKHGGKISASKYKSLKRMREEYQRAVGFLKTETGTIKGFAAWESKVSKTLMDNAGIDYNALTPEQKKTFWKAYSKLEELDAANVYGAKYRTSVNEIYTAVKDGLKNKNIDALVNQMNTKIYEESSKNFLSGANDPFSLIDDSDNPFTGG